ncbi:hypothetical protein [Acholeplasma laidlawii]|uniref:hypothetical protein n=1 Tax=Acholeplasma laidlawii TaxID=2148 RepID=UPI002541382B|nr:hypothetical protein QOL21_07630 [Acholeplasma laidlawii]
MSNVSKIKRDELLGKIKKIKDFLLLGELDENKEELINYLNDIKLEVDGKKYGLIFKELRKP